MATTTTTTPKALTVWLAGRLGPQIHAGLIAPDARRMKVATMRGERWKSQPAGGFWTATELPPGSGSSSYVAELWLRQPQLLAACGRWRLVPRVRSRARLVVIAGDAGLRAILRRFPYGAGQDEIDFAALAAAGYAGVHVTAAGIAACERRLPNWLVASTWWASWCFTAAVEELRAPQRASAPDAALTMPSRDAGQEGVRRFLLPAALGGLWFTAVTRVPPEVEHPLRVAFLARGQSATPLGQQAMVDLARAILTFAVTSHNFTDADGRLLPTGPGLLPALPTGIATAVVQVWLDGVMLGQGSGAR